MIGPHQGKELELMLSGKKHLAVFHDIVPADGIIPEDIIPENAFAPYVQNGRIKRISREETHLKNRVRYVLYTLPGHEWRADAFLWMHDECVSGRRPFDDAYEYFVGRLLDYSEEDIKHYIEHWKAHKSALRASA